VERLHEAHGRTARPVKTAGRGGLEVEGEVAEGDGPQAAIGEHADVRRNGVGESESLAAVSPSTTTRTLPSGPARRSRRAGWYRWLSGEPVVLGYVVEAARNPPQASGSNQPVESLIDCRARSKVGKVLRGPDARLRRGGGTVPDGGWNAGCRSGHS